MIAVFIAGASASGKTSLIKQISAKLKELHINCLSIRMDDYYKEIPPGLDIQQYKQTTNFDEPTCLDLLLLKDHITALNSGQSINKPLFDFKTERRIGVELMAPPSVLLIDGTASLFFANAFMPDLESTFKIFIETIQETLLKRRIERDRLERGYADEESILKKDTAFVRPTFISFIEPTKNFADLLIDNNEQPDLSTLNPLITGAAKVVELLEIKLNMKTKLASANFFVPVVGEQNPQSDTYCGFKPGFLLGQRF